MHTQFETAAQQQAHPIKTYLMFKSICGAQFWTNEIPLWVKLDWNQTTVKMSCCSSWLQYVTTKTYHGTDLLLVVLHWAWLGLKARQFYDTSGINTTKWQHNLQGWKRMSQTEYENMWKLTPVTYRGLNCTVPKSPRITVMMWMKFVRIGAHWYPRKSNICRSKMLI